VIRLLLSPRQGSGDKRPLFSLLPREPSTFSACERALNQALSKDEDGTSENGDFVDPLMHRPDSPGS
ncbi:hypothetical protein HAX54_023701, partial [Datura stramonium]|nr:hypothetical protein [Datura stramonium]